MRSTKADRIAELEAALRRIERESGGYDHMSRLGWINTTARYALNLPLTDEQQTDIKAMHAREEEKRS